ncbi:MAG: PspC domain-containing protein [Phycisphaerales bacterium]|nr:MAG: PspC domain-containing protein [Phycisphaerales bacterium]UCF15316.1 MAG: PspC domain-containing protein [Phycisphaerales bacterium]
MNTYQRNILKRSSNSLIGGVCAGISEWLGWPSATRVRVVYVLASILSAAFPGILVYIILWIILPGPDYVPPGTTQSGN